MSCLKLGMAALLSVILLFFLPSAGQSQALTQKDLEEIEIAMFREPLGAGRRLEAFLLNTDPEAHPELWLKALVFHIIIFQGDFDAAESERIQASLMEKAKAIVERMPESGPRLEYETQALHRRLRLHPESGELKKVEALYENLIERATKIEDREIKGQIYADYANYLSEQKQSAKAVDMANVAIEEIRQSSATLKPLNKAAYMGSLAYIYYTEGKPKEAVQIWKEIMSSVCSGDQYPYFCNPILTNLAASYIQEKTGDGNQKALAILDKASRNAELIDDQWTVGMVLYRKAIIHADTQNRALALKMLDEATQRFRALKDVRWLSNVLIMTARVRNQTRSYARALQDLTEAEQLLGKDHADLHQSLHEVMMDTYVGLQDYERAFTVLKTFHENKQKEWQEKSTESYNYALASVGLQLEKEKNRVLERDKEIAYLKLHESEKIRRFMAIGMGLMLLLLCASLWLIYQSALIRRIKNELQNVLDSIDEAIFSVDKSLVIHGPCSRFVQAMRLDKKITEGAGFVPMILDGSHLTTDEIALVKESLQAMMGEGELAWELNCSHLPLEISYAGTENATFFSIHWQPIWNHHRVLSSIMVSMRDVTERRVIVEQIASERQARQVASQCLLELAQANLGRVRQLMADLSAFLQRWQSQTPDKVGQRDLHTFKGLARSLGLSLLSQEIHNLESLVKEGAARYDPIIALQKHYEDFLNQLQVDASKGSDLPLGLCGIWERLQSGVLRKIKGDGLHYGGVWIKDGLEVWPPNLLPILESCMIHAMNNTIDHGFVKAMKQGRQVPAVNFEILAVNEGPQILVSIRDNGAGLDWERLRERAQQRNFPWTTQDELSEIIFADGVTTQDVVHETSGRGIGMSAVRALCREQGGDAIIRSRADGGAELILTFPAHIGMFKTSA